MPLVSKISPRTRDVTEADFESVPQITDYTSSYGGKSGIVQAWNNAIHFMPKDFVDLFDGLIEPDDEFHISSSSSKKFQFDICTVGTTSPFLTQMYDLQRNNVENSYVHLPLKRRGNGTGKALAVAAIDMDVMLGIPNIVFEATLEMGAYAWLKSGYKLDNTLSVFEEQNQRLSKLAMAKLSAVESLILVEDFERAMTLAESFTTPEARELANMDFDMRGALNEARLSGQPYDRNYFERSIRQYLDAYPEVEKGSDVNFFEVQARSMAGLIKSCKLEGLPLTVGKFALASGSAYMMADYQDDEHITDIIENMGGFRNSVIVPAAQQRQFG